MSVLMTLRVAGDPTAIEKLGADNGALFEGVIADASSRGLISHHFYGSENEVLVVDEWPDEASFQAFFEHSGPQIEQMMASAGVTTQPSIEFWRHLEVGDDVG
jgi:heme-degrading monooxygenase HmoA